MGLIFSTGIYETCLYTTATGMVWVYWFVRNRSMIPKPSSSMILDVDEGLTCILFA